MRMSKRWAVAIAPSGLPSRRLDLVALVGFALLLAFPFVSDDSYITRVLIQAFIFAILGLGYNLVIGVTGLLAFSQATFWAIGAYAAAILNVRFELGIWYTLPLAVVVSGAIGALYGAAMLRFRSHYLAMATLGLGVIFGDILRNWGSVTGGSNGLLLQETGETVVGPVRIPELTLVGFYLLAVIVLAVTSYLILRLRRSDMGLALLTIRENVLAARAFGLPVRSYQVAAFAVSAMCGGVGGSLYAHYITVITPEVADLSHVVTLLLILVLGGLGGHYGIIVGALVVVALPEYLRFLEDTRMIVYGFAVLLILVLRHQRRPLIALLGRVRGGGAHE